MAGFYGSMSNSRGNEVTAQGSSKGQRAHIRGWHSGIRVESVAVDSEDVFRVYATGGSSGHTRDRLIGILSNGEWIPVGDEITAAQMAVSA